MSSHPAAEAAKEKAILNAELREVMVNKEIDLTNEHGLRFLHIRDNHYDGPFYKARPKGGATVAYRFIGRDRIEVSLATCHKNDLYSKPAGRLQAALNFEAGKRIELRIPKDLGPTTFIKTVFALAGKPSFSE
jgi:hypothetical protein